MSIVDWLSRELNAATGTAVISVVACAAVVIFLLWLARSMNDTINPSVALLVACLGGVLGWGLSVLWVPYGIVDRQIYGQIATTIGAFLSGYVVSKLYKLIDAVLFTGPDRSSLNLPAIKYSIFFIVGMVAIGSTIISNRIEWLSMAVQCDPGLYGPFDGNGKPTRSVSSEEICKKYNLPAPSTFAEIAPTKGLAGTSQDAQPTAPTAAPSSGK
jgi:hypothetical protein